MIRGNAIFKVFLLFLVCSADLSILYSTVADSREGPGEPGPPPPLLLDLTEARRAGKFFFVEAPPPYLKVYIAHWVVSRPTA